MMKRSRSRLVLVLCAFAAVGGVVFGIAEARWKAGGANEIAVNDLQVCRDGARFQVADNFGTELELRIVELPGRAPLAHRLVTNPRDPLEIAFEGPNDDDVVKRFTYSQQLEFRWPRELADGTEIEVFVRQNNPGTNNQRTDTFVVRDCRLASIHVNPRRAHSVDPTSRGTVRVAILSTSTFDATQAQRNTVRFGAVAASGGLAGVARTVGDGRARDVDHDGIADLILRFRVRDTGISCGTKLATLIGRTSTGIRFQGSDAIVPRRC
jgi:hypothetical protein